MPKIVPINRLQNLVDAATIAKSLGRSPQWVNSVARAGKLRWHGVKSGVRTRRFFDPEEVREDMFHDVKPEVPRASA